MYLKSSIRAVALATLVAFATVNVGCGYVLYPERRGNTGNIDGGTLVMDLLWLLPGIVPGVVFLIVDFTSGAMYVNGRGRVALRIKRSPTTGTVDARVVTASHRVLDEKIARVGPTVAEQAIELGTTDRRGERLFVEIVDPDHPATHPFRAAVR